MKRKKEKPIYGNSQGAKSGELNSNSKKPPEKQYVKTGDLSESNSDRLRQQYSQNRQFTQLKPATIKSIPRTILKIGILGVIAYQGLVNTPIGRSLMDRVSQQLANTSKKIDTTRSKLDPKMLGETRQKNSDDRIEDAWQRAGGESDRK